MKKLLIALAALLVLAAAFYAFNSYIYNEKQAPAFEDYKAAYYVIDGERVTLGEGNVKYFGNEIRADLDADGADHDVAFLITNQPGGSGTFYYAVAAIHTDRGYLGSSAYYVGDRIAPQSTTGTEEPGEDNVIAFNYADRADGEPMSATPSVGKGLILKFDPSAMQFELVRFEGEGGASAPAPQAQTLEMQDWTWIEAEYNDGTVVKPNKPEDFVLSFKGDRFSVDTDCNSMAGKYEAIEGMLTFSDVAMTKMFCQGSKEDAFAKIIENTSGYHFAPNGDLILDLKFDSGTGSFR